MKGNRRDRSLEWIGIPVLIVAALLIVAWRAATVSITHDEAITVVASLQSHTADIFSFDTPGLPDNNHLLYTVLERRAAKTWGEHEWSLRLPSVLAFVLYAIAITAILRRFLAGGLLVLFTAIALLNPALLEAMSLARGYGLGIALMCAGVYWLLRSLDTGAKWYASALSALCLALATLAHLTFLLPMAMGLAVIFAGAVAQYRHHVRTLGQVAACAILPIATVAVVAPILLHQIEVLRPMGLLATEGRTSFFANTIVENAASSLGGQPGAPWTLFAGIAILAVPVLTAMFLVRLRPRIGARAHPPRDALVVLTLLVGVAALSVLQHYIAGVAYLSGRRALSLVPLFVITCAALTSLCLASPRIGRTGLLLAGSVCSAVLALQVRAINLDATQTWPFDADTRVMMIDLDYLIAHEWDAPVFRLALPWELEPAANYYRTHIPVARLAALDRGGVRKGFDAYYLPSSDRPEYRLSLAAGRDALGPLTVIKRYPRANAVLAVPPDSPLLARIQADSAPTSATHCR